MRATVMTVLARRVLPVLPHHLTRLVDYCLELISFLNLVYVSCDIVYSDRKLDYLLIGNIYRLNVFRPLLARSTLNGRPITS